VSKVTNSVALVFLFIRIVHNQIIGVITAFRSKGIANWEKYYIFADELIQGMMKRTTINFYLCVILVTTMSLVMSIQTAGAQSKDPIEEGFLRDQKKAYEENEDIRKGGHFIGMAPKVAIPHFEKAANSSNPAVRRVAIISAASFILTNA
jgi:hypothetical protein